VRRRTVLALCALLPLVACGAEPSGGSPAVREVEDATGAVVRLRKDVRRVVTTLPGLTQTVIALGAQALLVGVSDQDKTADVAASVERLPVWPAIPAERVAALTPDLLLLDPTLSPQDLPALRRRFAFTFASDSTSLDGLARTFRRLGAALGRDDAAARLVASLETARANARVEDRPKVLLLTWADPPMALGPGSLLDDMLRTVGAENVAHDLPGPSRPLSSEVVRARAPEWILLTGGTFPESLRVSWADVPAVKAGRIVDVSGDDFVQAGPRTEQALKRLAEILSGRAPR
jgi:iron complex transport system substrate-binding protein